MQLMLPLLGDDGVSGGVTAEKRCSVTDLVVNGSLVMFRCEVTVD
jgi:hypothetical protein